MQQQGGTIKTIKEPTRHITEHTQRSQRYLTGQNCQPNASTMPKIDKKMSDNFLEMLPTLL